MSGLDYAKAYSYFFQASQHGNTIALYYLAQMTQYGYGTQANCASAVLLYKRVAERGTWSDLLEEGLNKKPILPHEAKHAIAGGINLRGF